MRYTTHNLGTTPFCSTGSITSSCVRICLWSWFNVQFMSVIWLYDEGFVHWPLRSVPESCNIWWNIPSGARTIESTIKRVEWLEHVESVRIWIEHLTKKWRTTSLIRQHHYWLGFILNEWMTWHLSISQHEAVINTSCHAGFHCSYSLTVYRKQCTYRKRAVLRLRLV